VSIASLQSNSWANPWAASATSQSRASAPTGSFVEINEVQANFSTAASKAPWSGQNAAGMSGASTSPANPLARLASDIQAMLIQAQSAGPTGAANASTPQAATPTPEQNVATDLQTLLGDIQSAVAPNTQTANSNATAPTGGTEHHHHHHHHEGGGEANGASGVAATSPGPGASTAGSQFAGDQAVSSTFASDIAQAIQAYGGGASAAMPALMV
jgi:hypothetical protein